MNNLPVNQLPDLRKTMSELAAKTSALFIMREMPKAYCFQTNVDALAYAVDQAPSGGMALEFGVASGRTLRLIARLRHGRMVYGFDSFEGLPEDWRTHYHKGHFALSEIPEIDGATIVPGLFEKTLFNFLYGHDRVYGPIDFVHIDSDLYSSAKTVLDQVVPRLSTGSIILFDEYFNYPTWEDHEHKAWEEAVEKFKIDYDYIGYVQQGQQVIVRVNGWDE